MMTSNHLGDHDDLDHDDLDHDDFGGLGRDLPRIVDRRRALQWVGGVGLAGVLAACGSNDGDDGAVPTSSSTPATDGVESEGAAADSATSEGTASTTSTTSTSGEATTVAEDADLVEATPGSEIPDETAGPFPADGTNGPNVLIEDGVVRSDLTTSIGSFSGTAEGVPTAIQMTIVDAGTGDPVPGAAVYIWHNAADGRYSVYEIADQNYLRGIQVADDSGRLTFNSIYPGCYPGRWPHCHFEVYESLDAATNGSQAMKTSQLALPKADSEAVYADSRYGDSAQLLGELSLSTDGVFRDGWEEQLATVAGDPTSGFTASLLVRI